jgi:transposase-like protein
VKDYLDSKGVRCPFCKSDQIEGSGSISIEDYQAVQDVSCLKCKRTWTDVYTLSGVYVEEG